MQIAILSNFHKRATKENLKGHYHGFFNVFTLIPPQSH